MMKKKVKFDQEQVDELRLIVRALNNERPKMTEKEIKQTDVMVTRFTQIIDHEVKTERLI